MADSLRAASGSIRNQVELAEFTINHRTEEILRDIYRRKPDVLFFSCYIWNMVYVTELTAECKQVMPEVPIWLGGPEVSYDAEEFLRIHPEVDGILGTGSYAEIVPAIASLLEEKAVSDFQSIDAPEQETWRILTTPKHYAYIKIAEGCDNHCAYCVIPSLRGKYRSRRMEDVLLEAKRLAQAGVKELIVVAQDTSRYGTDLPEHTRLLPKLLRELCRIDGIHWVRVHYVYPDEIDDELIQVMAQEPKIVKYLDIPIQHCNDGILKRMNRRGSGAFLRELLGRLREQIPGLVIRTSLITGLPGEGEDEFRELCDFLREMRMERVGAFPFSPEEGTPAAQMEHVDADVAMERAQKVEMLQSEIMDAYNASVMGKTLEVLVDGYDEEFEQFYGRTFADSPEIDGRVWIAAREPLHEGDFVQVTIDGTQDGDLTGFISEEEAQ